MCDNADSAEAMISLQLQSAAVLPLTSFESLQAVWTEFLCTLLFIYLATGSVVFGCSTTETSDGTTGTTGSSGGTTGEAHKAYHPAPVAWAAAFSTGIKLHQGHSVSLSRHKH